MSKYYFTFGSDPKFPYQRGWVEVEAKTRNQACNVFRAYFPDRHENCINCAFIYSEEEWQKTKMSKGDYCVAGEFCHAKIGLQERKDFDNVSIPVGDNLYLCAEINPDKDYREIYVGTKEASGCWRQDLAVVRQKYHYGDNLAVVQDEQFEVLVYADETQEDFTNRFVVNRWVVNEE